MSFSICRIAKIKSSGVTWIQIHDRREKGISHTNEDIDWNKTHENINLLEQQEKFRTVVKNRIEELNLNRAVRKDATVMVQCLITSDSTFFDKMNKDQQVEFFKKSYDFIKDRYGKKNMVSATIHFDERTPHMHVNFVPVTKDNRLSARDLFSPKQLRELQDDFNKYINDKGYDLERGKLDSKKKHLNVQEYKLETKFEELKNRESELDKKIKDLESERDTLKNDLNALKNDFDRVKDIKVDFDNVNAIEGKYGLINKKKITVKAEDFEKLKDIAKRQHVLDRKLESLERENSNMRSDLNKYKSKSMESYRKDIEREKTLRGMSKELETVKEYLTKNNQLDDYRGFRDQQKQIQKQMKRGFDLER